MWKTTYADDVTNAHSYAPVDVKDADELALLVLAHKRLVQLAHDPIKEPRVHVLAQSVARKIRLKQRIRT